MRKTAITAGLLALIAHAVAQNQGQERPRQGGVPYPPRLEGARVEVYKEIGATKLNIYVYEPPNHKSTDRRAAIVFFFGGGWNSGSPAQFEQQCRYLASRGMVAMTADYRVASRHAVKVVDCIKDAKSAVRWIRTNAGRLGIDQNLIAAGGGSAGAHIAAAAATIRDFDEPGEDRSTSSVPNALVLFNPPAALARYGDKSPLDSPDMARLADRFGSDPQAVSPAHHVRSGAPPAILFFGTADRLLGGAEYFCDQMKQQGSRCELVTYEGEPHGFFNFGRSENKYFLDTLKKADAFLVSLGYLKGEPTVDQFAWKASGQ
jgi:acetyl esterase/lipase